jgi:hypothetical protein
LIATWRGGYILISCKQAASRMLRHTSQALIASFDVQALMDAAT